MFVCMGNICRSPIAQGVFEALVCREGLEGEISVDEENYRAVSTLCRQGKAEVRLFLDYASERIETEVPDPYYGRAKGFERVLDLVEAASEGLLEEIKKKRLLGRV